MLVNSIQPLNFRNLEPVRLDFSPHANFISGRNGQGKTNLLEALYWLITLNGKRGTVTDCTRRGEPGFSLRSSMTFGDLNHQVELHVEGRSRKLTIDGTAPRRRRDYLQEVLVVDFFPEDLLILIMEPSLRRRFIDFTSVQHSLEHEEVLRRFKRILEQRNSLLKSPNGLDRGLLASFDAPLAEAAAKVTSMRLYILAKLGAMTDSIFRDGIGEKYDASLFYKSCIEGIPEAHTDLEKPPDFTGFRDIYFAALCEMHQRDIDAGRTIIGPHRDDWGMTLDGKPVRVFASRGEVRSAMFALHLARFHVLTEKRGIRPVVLIDDVMSELDRDRRNRVMELLPPGQIFMTSCDPPPVKGGNDCLADDRSGEMAHFVMESGKAERRL